MCSVNSCNNNNNNNNNNIRYKITDLVIAITIFLTFDLYNLCNKRKWINSPGYGKKSNAQYLSTYEAYAGRNYFTSLVSFIVIVIIIFIIVIFTKSLCCVEKFKERLPSFKPTGNRKYCKHKETNCA
jgi:hypothetical protein